MLGRPWGRRNRLFSRPLIGKNDARYFAWAILLFVVGYVMAAMPPGGDEDVPIGPDWPITIYRPDTGETVTLDLESYLVGVVAAEMPALFHFEALKAQAVAARTFILYRLARGEPIPEAAGAVITADPSTGQGWLSQDQSWERWGPDEAESHWERVQAAVRETRGEVLVYAGQPIFAAYHSSSGGHTEDSENYWSSSEPYLRGVPDPFDTDKYRDRVVVLPAATVLTSFNATAVSTGDPLSIRVIERFPSGRVKTVQIGNTTLSGREFREALGLQSTMFDIETIDGQVRIIQQGYGHGVGMPQYGAQGMALAGYTYDEILRYYYRGVEIVNWYER